MYGSRPCWTNLPRKGHAVDGTRYVVPILAPRGVRVERDADRDAAVPSPFDSRLELRLVRLIAMPVV